MEGVQLTIGPYVQTAYGDRGPGLYTINAIQEFNIRGNEADNYEYTKMADGAYYQSYNKGLRIGNNTAEFTNGGRENSSKLLKTNNLNPRYYPSTMVYIAGGDLITLGESTAPQDDESRLIFTSESMSCYLAAVNKSTLTTVKGRTHTRIDYVTIYIKYDGNKSATASISYSNEYMNYIGSQYVLAIAPIRLNDLINKDIETDTSSGWTKYRTGVIESEPQGYDETLTSLIVPLFVLYSYAVAPSPYLIWNNSVRKYNEVTVETAPSFIQNELYNWLTIPSSSYVIPPPPRLINITAINGEVTTETLQTSSGQLKINLFTPVNTTKYPNKIALKTLQYDYEPRSNKTNDKTVVNEGSGGEGTFEGYDKIISDSTDGLNGHLWADYNGMFKSSVSNYIFGHYPINDVTDTNAARHLIGAAQRFTWGNFTKLFNKKDLDIDDLFVRGYFLPFKKSYILPETTWTYSVPTYGLFNEPIAAKTFEEASGDNVVKAMTSSYDTSAATQVISTLGKETSAIAFTTTEPYYYMRSLFRFQKIDYGKKKIDLLFDDYNDFINTNYKLTLPFGGGEHELDPNDMFRDVDGNKTLTCELEIYGIIDLDSGMMLINVLSNENILLQVPASPAVDMVLTGRNDSKIISNVATMSAAAMATTAAVVTKGLGILADNSKKETSVNEEDKKKREEIVERRLARDERKLDLRDRTLEERRTREARELDLRNRTLEERMRRNKSTETIEADKLVVRMGELNHKAKRWGTI